MDAHSSFDRLGLGFVLGAFASSAIYLATPLMPTTTPGWFQPSSLSFELVKGLPVAMIAAIAAYVAWRQWQLAREAHSVSRAKFKLDLFEQRLAIFDATWAYLSSVLKGKVDLEQHAPFTNLFPTAQFLFGLEVRDYMGEAVERAGAIWVIDEQWKDRVEPKKLEEIQRRAELMKWFAEQARVGCRERFAPYLDFGQWR